MDWISNVVFFNVPVKDDVLESGHNIYLKMCFFFSDVIANGTWRSLSL